MENFLKGISLLSGKFSSLFEIRGVEHFLWKIFKRNYLWLLFTKYKYTMCWKYPWNTFERNFVSGRFSFLFKMRGVERDVEDTKNFLGFEVATLYKVWFLRGEVMQKISMESFRKYRKSLKKFLFSLGSFRFVWNAVELSTSYENIQTKLSVVVADKIQTYTSVENFWKKFHFSLEVFIFV